MGYFRHFLADPHFSRDTGNTVLSIKAAPKRNYTLVYFITYDERPIHETRPDGTGSVTNFRYGSEYFLPLHTYKSIYNFQYVCIGKLYTKYRAYYRPPLDRLWNETCRRLRMPGPSKPTLATRLLYRIRNVFLEGCTRRKALDASPLFGRSTRRADIKYLQEVLIIVAKSNTRISRGLSQCQFSPWLNLWFRFCHLAREELFGPQR
jgi:hypothetical protein